MTRNFVYVIIILFVTLTDNKAQYTLQNAFPNLSFTNPVFLTHADDNTNRIFVVEQGGKIKVFSNTQTASSAKEFLNIIDRVSSGDEKGLLGLAFHPNYETNGYFYINYTADSPLRTIISRFQVTSNPDSADKNSEFQLLTFNQPYENHNGGWIGFGPNDGYLYVASGDGGSSGDPLNNGQRINTFLGKILRFDVDGGTPYIIPPTNPFYDSTNMEIKKEIFAWGLRNPWRCSIDQVTGLMFAGEVGQDSWEEIDIIQNGKNYGWRCYEGNHTFDMSECNYPQYTFPVWEYNHSVGYSITGGYVYRGVNVPALYGKYIYADFVSRKVWGLSYDGITPPSNELLVTALNNPTSFGVDQFNELYIVGFNPGNVYRFTPIAIVNTFPLSISVNNSWNMVSTPGLHPTNQNVTTWWSGKDPTAGVFRFSGGYVPITTTIPGQGYWMKHVGANIYNTGGEWPAGGIQIVPNAPITGATGWNLIGGYELSVLTSGITTTPAGLQSGQVFQYGTGYTVATNLVPGYGYWIKLTGAGSINIPNTLAKGLANTIEVNTSDWGKIIITDKSGKSYTLYTVKGEVNLNDYELPPAPPEGMFDVRFGSGRYAEELSAENQTIELNSLEYPVRVRVENADIRLQDGTGNGLNERLKSGEEVVISNSSVNKLMVSGNIIPATYSLDQNYPNPFNSSSIIKYSIPKSSLVTLKIFNTLGEEIATLVNEEKLAGTYELNWNASNLPSGVYFYVLHSANFIQTRKMILLK